MKRVRTHPRPSRHFAGSTRFRKWAKDARLIASTFNDARARQRMFAIAAEYDRMAEDAERHPASLRPA